MSDRLELTFEQQEQIDKLAYWASKPSSNQNKDKHALIAYVEQLIQSYIDSKIIEARIDELEHLFDKNYVTGIDLQPETITTRLKALNHRKDEPTNRWKLSRRI